MIFGWLTAALGVSVTNVGYTGGAIAQQASAVYEATKWAVIYAAVMRWQRNTNGQLTDIRAKLAQRRVVLAENVLDHAKKTWAAERAFVTDTLAARTHKPAYGTVYAVRGIVERTWAEADRQLDYFAMKTGTPVTRCDDIRVSNGMAAADVDLEANAMRAAEARALQLDDRRFDRQRVALGLGRGKLQSALSMAQLAGGRETSRRFVEGTINSALGLWGYQDHRWQNPRSWQERRVRTDLLDGYTWQTNPQPQQPQNITIQRDEEGLDALIKRYTGDTAEQ